MKRFLQKTLFRLQTLLLLAVMFVVGASAAWAEVVTVTFVGNTKTVNVSNSSLLSASVSGGASANNGVMGLGADGTFTVSAGTGKKITSISFSGTTGNLEKMTSDVPEYSNGTWTGEAAIVTFTSTASFVDIAFGSGGPKFSEVNVNVESAVASPIDYHLEIVNAPDASAKATLDGVEFGTSGGTRSVAKELTTANVTNVTEYSDYYYDVTYTEGTHTFTVTYYAYTKYSVELANDSEYTGGNAGVVVSEATYGNGTYSVGTNVIKSKGALTQSNFAAKVVQLYDGTVTLNGNTVTVKYTRKVADPFNFSRFDPSTGSTSTSISEIKLYPPQNEKFVNENLDSQIDLTFVKEENGEQVERVVKAKFSTLGYEGSFITLKIQQLIGGSYYDGQFTEAGSWGITIPAGFAYLENGSANNAAQVAYVVASFAQLTEVSPANNSSITNNDLIGGDFVLTFDKNINSVETYNVSVTFPDTKTIGFFGTVIKTQQEAEYYHKEITPLDEYPFGYNGRDALRVSNAGNKITFTPTAQFWQYYKNHLTTSGYIKFSIDANGITDENNLQNNALVSATYSYSYEAPESAVESSNPEVGTYSLDDREDGLGNITLTFADNFAQNVSLQSGDDLPDGMTFTLPAGVTRGLIWANSGDKTLHIGLNGANVAGDYRLQIAKGTFNFENATFGEGVNAAVDQTWTLTAATTFRVDTWSNVSDETSDNVFTAGGSLKKLASFKVTAPEGKTFASVTNPVNVTVNDEEVSASVAIVGADAVFTFPAAYAAEGSVSVNVPAGAITTADALTSKAFTANFTIQPYDYFEITVDPATQSSHTGRLNTIVVTLPAGKTAATVGEAITLNGNSVNVTNVIAGNTVTLTLAEDFPYTTYNYYSIPAGFIVDAEGNKNSAIYPYNITVVKQMMYASAYVNGETTTTNSVTVEKFSSVRVYFDEPFNEYVGSVPANMTLKKGSDEITINAGWCEDNTWEEQYGGYKYHSFFFLFDEISAPGTYTLHIPAGVFTSTVGNTNEEVNLDIVIPTPEYFAAMTVTPATGTTVQSLKTITLTAPEGVTFNSEKGLQGYPTVNGNNEYSFQYNYQFAPDNKSVTFDFSEQTTDGEYIVVFPAGFVRSTDGKWSPALTATYTVSYPWFTLSRYNVTPATGEVAAINGITIAAPDGVEFADPAANVTIVVNGVDTQVAASLVEGKIVLDYSATAANRYEISIPAETFTASDGFKKNKELTGITYTIQPTLAINEHAVDTEGDHWTSFCLNKDFTLEDGYTPYIVRDNGEGGIKLEELLGTPIVDNYDVPFTTIGEVAAADHTASAITHANIADKYEITYSMSSRDGWSSWNGFDYINVNYSTKFYVRVLDPAYTPSEILPFIYDCGSYVDGGNYSVTQTADDSFTLEVKGQTVGGLRFAVATGTYNTPIVPANTGILVKGAAKSGIQYTPASGTRADVSGNLLWGCTQSQTKEVGDDNCIYKLAWESSAYDNFGFYWGSNDGHSMDALAGKAYLVLPVTSGGSNRMLIFGGHEETPTAIDGVVELSDDAPIFTLQGKRVSRENLPAGVYVKNGRKFIVK